MIEEIFVLAMGNGLWAVLFCVLLLYQLTDSRKREHKYCETVNSLCTKLGVVNEIKKDTEKLIEDSAVITDCVKRVKP